MTNIKNLPEELQKTGQFCCWRYEQRQGADKPTKVPYNPETGGRALSTNPATFAPLAVADAVQSEYNGLGVGIFGSLGAIDIDNCINEDGSVSAMAADIMATMSSYTEISPSKKGIHILYKATGFEYDKSRYYINNQGIGLEVYIAGCTNKYVTVTGDVITDYMEYRERGPQVEQILDRYMRRENRHIQTSVPPSSDLDDLELLSKIRGSKNGENFSRLWAGDTSGYAGDDSRADAALCALLAFWTNCNADRMDRLFRQSGLMREKWDRPTAGSTYGGITIQAVIDIYDSSYDPQTNSKRKRGQTEMEIAEDSAELANLHPEKNERYGWNDIGNGNLFADWYKGWARYVPERKKWFVYNGKVWREDTGNLRVMELCKMLADKLNIYALSILDERQRMAYLDHATKWQVRSKREIILKDAASVYPVSLAEFDADPLLLNCINGTLDLRTLEFRPHKAGDMLSKMSGVRYDPKARCKRWEDFIAEVMSGDKGKAVFLQKALGLTLTGDTSHNCFFVLFGPKTRNGKGTTMETHMKLMGDYGRTANPDTISQHRSANGSGPSEDIARLAGARFVNISEPDKRLVLSSALVKTLTGDDSIAARFLHENSFEYRPQFKLFINTNHLPTVTDATLFISGRVKVIPFERHFEESEQDHELKTKLGQAESLSGILNWCLDGLRMIRENGFDAPTAVLEATDRYRQDSDKISRFIADELEADPDYEVQTSAAYERYNGWCEKNGYPQGSIKSFTAALENAVTIKRKRPKGGGNPVTMILGLRLRATLLYPECSSA